METIMKVERSIVINAPQARVWRAITEPAQLARYFDVAFEFARLAPGETIQFSYEGQPEPPGVIETVEPMTRFAFRWQAEPNQPVMTLVTFVLDATDEGTRVTVTEEGFEALTEDARQKRHDDNAMGWGMMIDALKRYVEDGDARPGNA